MRALLAVLLVVHFLRAFPQTWTKVEGLTGGSTEHIRATSEVIMVTVRNQGLYYSSDTGNTWQRSAITKHVDHLLVDGDFVVAIASGTLFTSSDHCKTFVARCPVSKPGAAYLKNGCIYLSGYTERMSPDTGKTWFPSPYDFAAMAVSGQNWYVAGYSTFSVSHDGGKNFVSLPGDHSIRHILLDSARVWAVSSQSVLHSADHGKTWTTIYAELAGKFAEIFRHNDTLYLINKEHRPEVLFSADEGNTWKKQPAHGALAARWFTNLCIHKNAFFKTGSGVWRSRDRAHWQRSDKGIRHANLHRLHSSGSLLLAEVREENSRGQFLYSSDNGDSWQAITDLDSTYAGWKECTFSNGLLFAADWHYGVYYSADTGRTWKCVSGRTSFGVRGLHYRDGVLYYADHYLRHALLATPDLGASWDSLSSAELNGWATDTWSSDKVVLHMSKHFLKTTNKGKTWTPVYLQHFPQGFCYSGTHFYASSHFSILRADAEANSFQPVFSQWALSIDQLAAHGSEVLASKKDTLLYSPDAGMSWAKLLPPASSVSAVAANGDYLFIALGDQSLWRGRLRTTAITESSQAKTALRCFPNPAQNAATITVEGRSLKGCTFVLYDIGGKAVRSQVVDHEPFVFRREAEQAGVYGIRITGDTVNASGKLVLD